MVKSFYEMAREVHKDRTREEYWQNNSLDNRAKQEYAKFCIWCRAFKDGDFSEKNFKIYQKEEQTKLDFWLKKRIAELFYNYCFEFNYKTMKWKSYKKSH